MPTGRPMEITGTELSATELRRAAVRSQDADAGRRMLALALALEGKSRKEAAERGGMDRQTLRDWGSAASPMSARFTGLLKG